MPQLSTICSQINAELIAISSQYISNSKIRAQSFVMFYQPRTQLFVSDLKQLAEVLVKKCGVNVYRIWFGSKWFGVRFPVLAEEARQISRQCCSIVWQEYCRNFILISAKLIQQNGCFSNVLTCKHTNLLATFTGLSAGFVSIIRRETCTKNIDNVAALS